MTGHNPPLCPEQGRDDSMRRRGPSPKKDPPEPPDPPECPGCGKCPPPTDTKVTHRGRDGSEEGDIICDDCGAVIESGVVLKSADRY